MKSDVTNSEHEILQVLWKAGRPLSRAEILKFSSGKTWKDNSVHILLNGMLDKGTIQTADFVRSGKVWARTYEPNVSAHDYYVDCFNTYGWPDPIKFVEYVVSQEDVSKETIDQMIEVIEPKKREMKSKYKRKAPAQDTSHWQASHAGAIS